MSYYLVSPLSGPPFLWLLRGVLLLKSGVGVLNAAEHCTAAVWGWQWSLSAGFVSVGMGVLPAPVPVCCDSPRAEGPRCLGQPGAVLGYSCEQGNTKLLQSQLGQSLCAWSFCGSSAFQV